MNHGPDSTLPAREAHSLAGVVPWLGSALVHSSPWPTRAVQPEEGGPEQDDDGPETWTGLPV